MKELKILSSLREGKEESGFTLIEILVVILIIGILSAIAIPVFLNQRQTANDAVVVSDVKNVATAMQTYFTTNPNAEFAPVEEIRSLVKESSGVSIIIMGTANEYCVTGTHSNGKQYNGGAWVNSLQPYYAYSSIKGGGGTITVGVSGEACYNSNRFSL